MGQLNKKLKNKGKNKPVASVPAVVCNNIEKVSLAAFIKCAVSKDYSALTISGAPSEIQLFFAWVCILSEYYILTKNREALKYVQQVCKMERINLKIQVVSSLVEALRYWYEPKLIAQLVNNWGYKLPFTDETLLADLQQIETSLQTDNFQLLLQKKQFEEMEAKDQKKGKKPTKEGYMSILYAIEAHRKQVYSPDEISAYKFAILYNELVEYSEAMKNTYKRKR